MATTGTERAAVRAPEPTGFSHRDRAALAVFGSWMLFGLYLDGWAHTRGLPETFFSPWHAVLYSGFLAGVLYFAARVPANRRSGRPAVGEPQALVGFVLFVAGAVGDMVWHEIFGIEVGLDALLSPTHLVLAAGGMLMVTAPIRSAWRDSEDAPRFRRFLPTLVCFTLAAALVAFFTMYASAFRLPPMVLQDGVGGGFGWVYEVHGITSILASNIIFVVAALLVLRRWRPPPGSFAFLFGVVALGLTGIDDFVQLPLVGAAVAGGLTADALVRLGGRDPVRRARHVGGLAPVALWGSWFAVFHAFWGVAWSPELWLGSIVLAALGGWGLSILAFPPPVGVPRAEERPARPSP